MWKLGLVWLATVWLLGIWGYWCAWRFRDQLTLRWRKVLMIVGGAVTVFWLWMGFHEFVSLRWTTWLTRLRAVPWIECTTVLVGVFAALHQRDQNERRPPRDRFTAHNGLVLAVIVTAISFAGVIVRPANPKWANEWKDGVCIQSEEYTCGPAAIATLAREEGIDVTEELVCRRMLLSQFGSADWDMLRALRSLGMDARVVWVGDDPATLPVPCLGMVRLMDKDGKPGIAHAIAVLDQDERGWEFGDPLGGRFYWTREFTRGNYRFSGAVIAVK